MRVQFERTGGFAGICLSAVIEGDSLPEKERSALENEIEAAGFFDLPESIQGQGIAPDRFHYVITIEQGGRQHRVEVGENGMPAALRPLVQHLELLARLAR